MFKPAALLPLLACLAPTLGAFGLMLVTMGLSQKDARLRKYGHALLILAGISVLGAIFVAVTKG